ncbi:MAG: cytochrome C [Planctomycetaceae bacterium]|nr:cytochrome C [Planctomycetaceae bacterium]
MPTAAANAQAPSLTAVEQLGKEIYFDDISHPGGMSCASCHTPTAGWASPDDEVNAHGSVIPAGTTPARFGNRKPPSAAYATFAPQLHYDAARGSFVGGNFFDGRATGAKLGNPAADQALGPFLNPVEMNNPDKANVLAQIAASPYAAAWAAAWGEPLEYDTPAKIEQNYDRIGLSIAAYEGSSEVNRFTSKYDYYLQGQVNLTALEADGLRTFEGKGKCADCHTSQPGPNDEPPLFTDFSYANLGVPKNEENPFYDMDEVLVDGQPVNPAGDAWVDPGLGGFLASQTDEPTWTAMADDNMGKHKTPTLRNVALSFEDGFTRAYMHNGVFKTLEEVVSFYNTRDTATWPAPEVADNLETATVGNLGLNAYQEEAIVAFMKTLTDGYDLFNLPGDFSNDGVVDSYDLDDPLLGWNARLGLDLAGSDFLLWQQQATAASAANVSEPASFGLGAAVTLALVAWRSRRGRSARRPVPELAS